MNRKGWTQEELDIVKKYYPKEGIAVKRRLTDRSENQIYGVAWHYGIKNESRKKREENAFPMKRYTADEIAYIRSHINEDGVEEVAKKLGRTTNAIRSIVCKLGLANGTISDSPYAWTKEEIEIVKKYFPKEGIKVKDRLPNRTVAAIYSEASHLGVAHNKRTRKSSNSAWTAEEDEIIKTHYQEDGLAKCCELLPSRSKQAIIVRANRHLNLKRRA